MLIKVTQEDIDAGQAWNCYKCPIALATRRAFTDRGIEVGTTCIWINDIEAYKTPAIAKEFIIQFDRSLHVSPIEFELTDRY